jgi:ankyrin repeat protein
MYLNSMTGFGELLLSWAVEKGHETIVKLLLEQGVNLNWKEGCSRVLLLFAAETGHEVIVELLALDKCRR